MKLGFVFQVAALTNTLLVKIAHFETVCLVIFWLWMSEQYGVEHLLREG